MKPRDVTNLNFLQFFDAQIACPSGLALDKKCFRSSLKGISRPIKFGIKFNRDFYHLVNYKGVAFAALDLRTSYALMTLQEQVQHLDFEAVLVPPPLESHEKKVVRSVEVQNIAINILGPDKSAELTGTLLSKSGRYLQHPLLLDYGVDYMNPHFLVMPSSEGSLNQYVKSRSDSSDFQDFLSEAVTELFESLDTVEAGYEIFLSEHVRTPLFKYYFPF